MSDIFQPTLATDGVLRPTHVEVRLDVIAANYRALCRHAKGRPVMAILKANAYGHGMIPVARKLASLGCPYFGLAYLEEGLSLRKEGIDTPILILGGIIGSQIPLFIQYDLTITASSVDKLRAIESVAKKMGKKAKAHLKIDTGMERIGVHHYSALSLLEESLRCEHVIIEGIFSHFANADSTDTRDARLQLVRFLEVLRFYEKRGLKPPIRHMANSGALLQLPDSILDMVRPGLLLYGCYPNPAMTPTIAIKPALRWVSRVVYFKVIEAGASVSYGSTWHAPRQSRLVTIPVGYGDGYMRRMSNRAHVLIRGCRYPVVGSICMDQVMVNIDWEEAYNADETVLLGKQGDEEISVMDLATWADTIPYEVFTAINTRVPRIYHDES